MVLTKHERQMNDNQYRGLVFDTLVSFALKMWPDFWDFTIYDDGDVEIDFNNGIQKIEKIDVMFPVHPIKIKNFTYITFDVYSTYVTLTARDNRGYVTHIDDNPREWFIENTTLY